MLRKVNSFLIFYTRWHSTGKKINKRLNDHDSLCVYVSKKHPILRIKIIVFIISPILLLFFLVIIFLIDDNDLVNSISIFRQCFEEKTWSSMFLTKLQRNTTLIIIAHPYPILLLLLVIIFLIDDNDLVNSMSCLGPVSRPINGQDLPQKAGFIWTSSSMPSLLSSSMSSMPSLTSSSVDIIINGQDFPQQAVFKWTSSSTMPSFTSSSWKEYQQ